MSFASVILQMTADDTILRPVGAVPENNSSTPNTIGYRITSNVSNFLTADPRMPARSKGLNVEMATAIDWLNEAADSGIDCIAATQPIFRRDVSCKNGNAFVQIHKSCIRQRACRCGGKTVTMVRIARTA